MRSIPLRVAVLALVALAAWCWQYFEANHGFTPWMTGAELQIFCDDHDTTPPGGHPNFWDKGHWIDAVEGRWHAGVPQYRLRYSDSPRGKGGYLWWYWYFNQDQESFSRHVHELADKGFTLLDPNSFLRPDDTRRYQGVWHKTQTKAEHDAEVARTGAAKTEVPSQPPSASLLPTTVIDQGTSLPFNSIDRAQLGHRCSVFLTPEAHPFLNASNPLPPGMITNRGDIIIITGTLFSISERMLIIMNQQHGYPAVDRQVDHVIFEP